MVHGDDSGLVLPPVIAPVQVVVIPVAMHKEGVLEKARIVASRLDGLRTVLDDSDNSPGWKFSEHEMKGVPLRIEIGPKDIEKNQAVLVRRDTREKIFVSLENIETEASRLLDKIQSDMLSRAKEMLFFTSMMWLTLKSFAGNPPRKPGFSEPCGAVTAGVKKK
jgi:prolyl-tRNA synthetase